MKILISGGLGFLGHHLCKRILQIYQNPSITIVDNLSSSIIDYSWIKNHADVIIQDFRDYQPGNQTFDQIYHLASPVGSLGILNLSGYIVKIISDLAVRAAEITAMNKSSLLYVSSSETYGKSGLQSESDNLVIPVSSGARMEYMLGKLSAEHILLNMSIRFGFRLTVVRPFNIIGEHQSSRIGFVVPTFFENAISNKPLPVFYGGSQTRCFCHVEDMVDGLIAVQESGKNREIYNMGNPSNEVSILNLGYKIKSICNSSSEIETVIPENIYGKTYIEASSKKPSIEKINLHTGWKPKIDLDSALLKIETCYKAENEFVDRN